MAVCLKLECYYCSLRHIAAFFYSLKLGTISGKSKLSIFIRLFHNPTTSSLLFFYTQLIYTMRSYITKPNYDEKSHKMGYFVIS